MFRKDHVNIAEILAKHQPLQETFGWYLWDAMVIDFTSMLIQDNAGFNIDNFMKACGYPI